MLNNKKHKKLAKPEAIKPLCDMLKVHEVKRQKETIFLILTLLLSVPAYSFENNASRHQFGFNLGIESAFGELGIGTTIGGDYSYRMNSHLGFNIGYSQSDREYYNRDNDGFLTIDNFKYYDLGILLIPFAKRCDRLKVILGCTMKDQLSLFSTSYYVLDLNDPGGVKEYGKLMYPQLIDKITFGMYASVIYQVYEKDFFSIGLKGMLRGPYEKEFKSTGASVYVGFKF